MGEKNKYIEAFQKDHDERVYGGLKPLPLDTLPTSVKTDDKFDDSEVKVDKTAAEESKVETKPDAPAVKPAQPPSGRRNRG